jgi:hypothetical protein
MIFNLRTANSLESNSLCYIVDNILLPTVYLVRQKTVVCSDYNLNSFQRSSTGPTCCHYNAFLITSLF